MFNKIYNDVRRSIQKNFSFIIYLLLIFIILCPVNYYIITGGGTFDAKSRVSIKTDNKIKGSFNMAYVSEIKGTLFTYLLSYIVPHYERESIDDYKANENEDLNDVEFRNKLWLNEANNSSIYVAYTKASKDISVKRSNTYIFFVDEKSKSNLKVGDEILSIDGKSVTDLDSLKKLVSNYSDGDKLKIKVKRNEKILDKYAYIYEESGVKYIGISIMEDIAYKTSPKVAFKFKKSESGPSGGLIMTLQIYNMLVKEDITKGRKIVGTGTIDKEGNVGEIDGVKHKLRGAVKDKADIFLVASGRNYKEALKEKKINKYKIKIIGVKTFDEALEKLK